MDKIFEALFQIVSHFKRLLVVVHFTYQQLSSVLKRKYCKFVLVTAFAFQAAAMSSGFDGSSSMCPIEEAPSKAPILDTAETTEMISKFASGFASELTSHSRIAGPDILKEKFPMSRRILMPAHLEIDCRKLLQLARVFDSAQDAGNTFLAILNDGLEDEDDPVWGQAFNRAAIRQMLEDTTDRFAQRSALSDTPVNATQRANAKKERPWDDLMFEFFDTVEHHLTEGDGAFLSRKGFYEEDELGFLCRYEIRRQQMMEFFVSKFRSEDSRAAHFLREQRLPQEPDHTVKGQWDGYYDLHGLWNARKTRR